MNVLKDGAWTFGWSALVAIGTLTLALFTWRLAAATKRLAGKTADLASETADEIAATYRPVIVPVADGVRSFLNEDPGGWTLRFEIKNGGAGPATFIRALHDPSGSAPQNWSLGSLAPSESGTLVFRLSSFTSVNQLLLDYRDLAGRTYSTAIVLISDSARTDEVRVYDVRFGTDTSFTQLGDASPQPGLRSLPIDDSPGDGTE